MTVPSSPIHFHLCHLEILKTREQKNSIWAVVVWATAKYLYLHFIQNGKERKRQWSILMLYMPTPIMRRDGRTEKTCLLHHCSICLDHRKRAANLSKQQWPYRTRTSKAVPREWGQRSLQWGNKAKASQNKIDKNKLHCGFKYKVMESEISSTFPHSWYYGITEAQTGFQTSAEFSSAMWLSCLGAAITTPITGVLVSIISFAATQSGLHKDSLLQWSLRLTY